MATDDGDGKLRWVVLASDASDEGFGTDDIESSDTKELLRVEDAGGLQHLSGDGHCGVDGVGDDEDVCLGGIFGDAFDESLDDTGVDLEEIIASHARLAFAQSTTGIRQESSAKLTGNARRNDKDVGASEGLL